MLRVGIEDCLDKISDRFELVVLAGQRARELALGAIPLLPKNNDKYSVITLREIAGALLDIKSLKNSVIKRNQRKQIIQIEDQPEQASEDMESLYLQEMATFSTVIRKKPQIEEDLEDEASVDFHD